jgi:type II restriction enzyme
LCESIDPSRFVMRKLLILYVDISLMELSFYRADIFQQYKSNSQRIRRLSEEWFDEQMYCPACKCNNLKSFQNNTPVADFYCPKCMSQFQLKSQSNPFGKRILDGAYSTMIDSIFRESQPTFFLMHYNPQEWSVLDLEIIPNFFFSESIIEKRKPLATTARRAGWIGCNILLGRIPEEGRISAISDSKVYTPKTVRKNWQNVSFLKNKESRYRGWIIDIMWCVKDLDKKEFSLADVYGYENHLAKLHPLNKNIKPKIRQQLQFLRDKRYLKFIGNGKYCLRQK